LSAENISTGYDTCLSFFAIIGFTLAVMFRSFWVYITD